LAGGSALASGAASAKRCPPWNGAEPPTGNGWLLGVAALPTCQVFGVGNADTEQGQSALVMQLTESAWSGESSELGSLAGVTAASAGSAWAVGTAVQTGPPPNLVSGLVLHWNGSRWERQLPPEPGGYNGYEALAGVAALSARAAWAVGSYAAGSSSHPANGGSPRRTLIVRWTGTAWSKVPSPNPGSDNRLTGVAVVNAKDAWAVGYYRSAKVYRQTLILHWNGQAWSQVACPVVGDANDNLLYAVSAASAGNAWAVGEYVNGELAVGLALHWNGQTWQQ
jgi:hypothetical protein